MHRTRFTITVRVIRWRNTSHISLCEVFAWAVSWFLMFKLLCSLFFKWLILININHAHLLIRTVRNNPKLTRTPIQANYIIFLDLWWKCICCSWWSTSLTKISTISTFNQIIILINIGKTDVFLFFVVLCWIYLLVSITSIYGTVTIFCGSLHY